MITVELATWVRRDGPQAVISHHVDVEMRAIWHPIIVVRGDADIARCLAERHPYTVVYDTEARP